MQWLMNNWSFLVVVACAIALVILYIRRFSNLPSEEQMQKVREWLLYAVVMAEKDLGAGTGQIKLRYVYDLFLERFPNLILWIPFETFSKMVDEALEKMKHLLETNKDIEFFVKGEEG